MDEVQQNLIKPKNIGWKILFWVYMILSIMDYSKGFDSIWKFIDLVVLIPALVGLYGFCWSKKILEKIFWKFFFFVAIVWNTVYFFVAIQPKVAAADLPQWSVIFGYVFWLLLIIPLFTVLYVYAFRVGKMFPFIRVQRNINDSVYGQSAYLNLQADSKNCVLSDSDKIWNVASNVAFILAVSSVFSVIVYLNKISEGLLAKIYLIIIIILAFIFFALGQLIKKKNKLALEVAIAILIILILENLVTLILFRMPLMIWPLILKFVFLIYLVRPLDSVQRKITEIKTKKLNKKSNAQ